MTSLDPFLRVAEASKTFYTDEIETYALSGIDLEIRRGEYVSIAEALGWGKSTLLSIIGLMPNKARSYSPLGRTRLKSPIPSSAPIQTSTALSMLIAQANWFEDNHAISPLNRGVYNKEVI